MKFELWILIFLIPSPSMFLAAHGLVDPAFFFVDFSDGGLHARAVDVPFFLGFRNRQMLRLDHDRRAEESEFFAQTLFEEFDPVGMDVVFFAVHGDQKGRRRVSGLRHVIDARGFGAVARERFFCLDARLQNAVDGIVIDIAEPFVLDFQCFVE